MTAINWGAPLEAVHEDGRVVPVTRTDGPDRDGDYWVSDPTGSFAHSGVLCCRPDGQSDVADWRIRNAPTPTPTNEVRERMSGVASDVADISPEAVRQAIALVREVAEGHRGSWSWAAEKIDKARAIVALLDPVDGDLLAMREDAKAAGWHDSRLEQFERGLLDLWKRARGRALAEAGK